MSELPPPPEGIVLAHFIVSDDVERSRRFYTAEVLGGRIAYSGPGGLTYVALANSWIIINVGGAPTDDKPAVTLETPSDPDRVSSFLNIRVRDIAAIYAEWSCQGRLTSCCSPKQHEYEIRCYIRDPDGHLIRKWVRPRTRRGTGHLFIGRRTRLRRGSPGDREMSTGVLRSDSTVLRGREFSKVISDEPPKRESPRAF